MTQHKYFITAVIMTMMWCAALAQQPAGPVPAADLVISPAADARPEQPAGPDPEDAGVSLPIAPLELEAPAAAATTFTGGNYMDRISPRYGYYTPAKEFSFAPVALLAGGFIAKAGNGDPRSTGVDFDPSPHKRLDDFIQYAPLAAAWGMKIGGVEGRSNWPRFVVSNALSLATMVGIAEGMKHTVKEMRPNGTDRHSFPSGHTATAFMAATIVHKEYGLTRSPWYSVGAYSLATATGVMRSLHNRHWVSDIMVGAGIGIISTDLGYLFADLIFKDRGIVRQDRAGLADIRENPSFLSGSLGVTHPFGDLEIGDNVMQEVYNQLPLVPGLTRDHLLQPRLRLGSTTTVNVEGARFINPHVGFGARLEVASMPVIADGLNVYKVDVFSPDGSRHIPNPYASPWSSAHMSEYFSSDNIHRYSMLPGHESMQAVDHLPMVSAQLGAYGSLPLSRRCALGAKVMAGYRMAGCCRLDAQEGIIPSVRLNDPMDIPVDPNDKDLNDAYCKATSVAGETIDLDVKNSMVFTTGLSFSIILRQNMGCKVYVDYSNSKFDYDLTYYRIDNAYEHPALYEGTAAGSKAVASASTVCNRSLNTISAGVALQMQF